MQNERSDSVRLWAWGVYCVAGAAIVFVFVLALTSAAPRLVAQDSVPEWCRALPRPEYKTLERVTVSDAWFEVYRPARDVFAIYEPHQSEEVISYLIVGQKRALLFDTGMGISDLKKVTAELTKLPVIVLNSHTHDDHVGDNWEFGTIYGMDTDFTRANARGSREDAQAEVTPDQICGTLPKGFDSKTYVTRPWKISAYTHDGGHFDLGGRTLEVIATPGHTPDAISLIDRANGLLFTGDTYYPAPIWLFRPETDLDAYAASIRRLAALAPEVKLVLGAHNIPVAPPAVLARLVAAFDAVRAGKVTATPDSPGKVLYKVDDISFLMRAPDKTPHPQP
ncbi:MAG TPA: MBL fold metallo-hydrolase [Candidatus Sulfotelmatobacter sp.]|nr:MBL fold metallo-hydrolase [Candidatus Sulfotelmatobacter sp.]